jgi:hypothetical protein
LFQLAPFIFSDLSHKEAQKAQNEEQFFFVPYVPFCGFLLLRFFVA